MVNIFLAFHGTCVPLDLTLDKLHSVHTITHFCFSHTLMFQINFPLLSHSCLGAQCLSLSSSSSSSSSSHITLRHIPAEWNPTYFHQVFRLNLFRKYSSPYACYVFRPSYTPWFEHHNNTWWLQITTPLNILFSSHSCYSFLGQKIPLNILHRRLFISMRHLLSHPYKSIKLIILPPGTWSRVAW